MNDTKIEPWTEADTDRAEQDVDAYGAIMSPEGYRIIAEVKRQAAEIERLTVALRHAVDVARDIGAQRDRAFDAANRATDMRPGLTEEEALATAGPLSRDIYNRIGLATGNKIGAPEWMRDIIAAALLRASRAAPAPASALPIDHPGVRDALRALAVAMCATQARDPEQKAQLQRGAEAYDALRYALGDKDPAAADAILPVRFPGDVAVPRRVLERLVDATQYEDDVREARDVARRVLHLDALRHEPARTDPEAARRLAEATQIDARLTEPIPDSIGPRGSSYDDAHASKRGATPQLAEARAERDRLDTMFRSYDGGDRPQSPPASLIRDLRAAEERVRELEAAK